MSFSYGTAVKVNRSKEIFQIYLSMGSNPWCRLLMEKRFLVACSSVARPIPVLPPPLV